MENIQSILNKKNIDVEIEQYGNYIAKVNKVKSKNTNSKLVLVTSTNPTSMGEGKTTLSIGLCDSLNKLGKNSIVTLREPSLGPVFGKKGGATGGGKAYVYPKNDINLHFTGDFHAITSANNLLSAVIDNHIYFGNKLRIKEVYHKRCIDMNDRELRKKGFIITAASEIMAILCLSNDINNLKERLGNIIIGINEDDEYVYAKELDCINAMVILLKDAIKPNLVQTGYNNLAIIHGGPFANIAHGCNSVVATKTALNIADYVVTEAGFGSDMGALKFLDIKCRNNNFYPDVIVINSTIKSLKYNGEGNLEKGICNLEFHIDLMKKFNSNVIVSLNKFVEDTKEEIDFLKAFVENKNCKFVVSTMYNDGEDGCIDLANEIINIEDNNIRNEIYSLDDSIYEKINKTCKLLGATKVNYDERIKLILDKIEKSSFNKLPICIAKTPASITDDSKILGYPKDFSMTITDINISNGAGFIVISMGNILMMPGLAKESNYEKMKMEDYINE
ncbi:MAG: formate--tetrahydrofolate ligase [Firmicutes bacterium]|nr:formate--tetrahydrofolate ligase [Bacillota bacterium]